MCIIRDVSIPQKPRLRSLSFYFLARNIMGIAGIKTGADMTVSGNISPLLPTVPVNLQMAHQNNQMT